MQFFTFPRIHYLVFPLFIEEQIDNIQWQSQLCSLLKVSNRPTGYKQAVDVNQVSVTHSSVPSLSAPPFLVPTVRLNLYFYHDIWKIAL